MMGDERLREARGTNGNEGERNHILRRLPPEEYAWLLPHLERLPMGLGDVLANADEPFTHVYFPESCVVSMVNPTEEGMVEVGTVGSEGMAGLSIFLDVDAFPSRRLVQVPGDIVRVSAHSFTAGVRDRPGLQHLLRRYTHAFLVQVSQTAACNRMHDVEQRCARWLLMTQDRVGAGSFTLTVEFLAFMLGTHRDGVKEATDALHDRGLIKYIRGRIIVLDRPGLEAASCDCYRVVRGHFMRALGIVAA